MTTYTNITKEVRDHAAAMKALKEAQASLAALTPAERAKLDKEIERIIAL